MHFDVFCVLRFLLRKPSDLFAVLVILLIWVFQDRSFAMSTPRYLALATSSRVSPCKVYLVARGERDLVMWNVGQNIPGQNIPCHFLPPRTKHPASICHPGQNIPCSFCHPGQNIPCHFCRPGQNIPCYFCHPGQNIPHSV